MQRTSRRDHCGDCVQRPPEGAPFAPSSPSCPSAPLPRAAPSRRTAGLKILFIVCRGRHKSCCRNLPPTQILITGNNVEITPTLKERIADEIGKVIARHTTSVRQVDVHCVVAKSERQRAVGDHHKCEATLYFTESGDTGAGEGSSRGIIVRVAERADNMYPAIEKTAAVLQRKLRKLKARARKDLTFESFVLFSASLVRSSSHPRLFRGLAPSLQRVVSVTTVRRASCRCRSVASPRAPRAPCRWARPPPRRTTFRADSTRSTSRFAPLFLLNRQHQRNIVAAAPAPDARSAICDLRRTLPRGNRTRPRLSMRRHVTQRDDAAAPPARPPPTAPPTARRGGELRGAVRRGRRRVQFHDPHL